MGLVELLRHISYRGEHILVMRRDQIFTDKNWYVRLYGQWLNRKEVCV